MKKFEVTIYLDAFEWAGNAKNATEAKKKALARLAKKKPLNMITRQYPSNKKDILVSDW